MHLICLHNVIDGAPDPFDKRCSRISAAEFEWFAETVSERFELVSFEVYRAHLEENTGHESVVALSFDDGFRGVRSFAAPVLGARGLAAIAFLNPPYLGNPEGQIFHFLELEIAFRLTEHARVSLSFWEPVLDLGDETARVASMRRVKKLLKTASEGNRRDWHREVLDKLGVERRDIFAFAQNDPRFAIMTEQEVRDLEASGWAIGSHGMHHTTLSMLPAEMVRQEIAEARDDLRTRFGWDGLPFAYPYGDIVHIGPEAPKACEDAGHPMAFTTIPGESDVKRAPFHLPRIGYDRFVREFGLTGAPD